MSSENFDASKFLKHVTSEPGVYRMFDSEQTVIYVGKAKNLKSRVRQYILGQDERFMVPFLVARSHTVEVIVVDSEKEALLLENTLNYHRC